MGSIFLASHAVPDPGFGVGLVRAGAEAGLVGGIADWFAVTALFRHPLGLPIPHTAIIPKNKARIAEALGDFVERHFLSEKVILRHVRSNRVGTRLSNWLTEPGTAEMLAGPATAVLRQLALALKNEDLQRLAERELGQRLQKVDVAPLLGRALRLLTTSGDADVLFERAVDTARQWLQDNRQRVEVMVREHSRWWIPKRLDDRIAMAIYSEAIGVLEDLRRPNSEARARFRASVMSLADDLLHSPDQRARVNAAKNRILEQPELRAWIASLWRGASERLLADLDQPSSRARETLQNAIRLTGEALARDPAMQAQIDGVVERSALLAASFRGEIGAFIEAVVKGWNMDMLTDRLELAVGSDLQYIRMSGTVVGACVGCLLFVVAELVF
jgi:uncharacterized membrane-anchored protein YjiN (DUF445 family)